MVDITENKEHTPLKTTDKKIINTKIIFYILSIFVILVVCFFSTVRLFYGVELTDEALPVAENLIVSKGALPFVENWFPMAGSTVLTAPFIKIYTSLIGGTDGIVLFYRFLGVIISIVTVVCVYMLLGKYIENKLLRFICLLPYIGFRSAIISFRGDDLSLRLLEISMVALAVGLSNKKRSIFLFFLGGNILALCVMCYPSLIVWYVLVLIILVRFAYVKHDGNILAFFLIGSAISTTIIIGYLIVNSSINELINGLSCLLKDNMYFQMKNAGISKLPIYTLQMIEEICIYLFCVCACFGAIVFIWTLISRNENKSNNVNEEGLHLNKSSIKQMVIFSLIFGVCADTILQIARYNVQESYRIVVYATTAEFIAVPFLWLLIRKNNKITDYLMALIWVPSVVWVVFTGVNTFDDIINRNWMLINGAFLVTIFSAFYIENIITKKHILNINFKSTIKKIDITGALYCVPIILVAAISFTNIHNSYTLMYREKNISLLNTKMETGPYKGIYTTNEREEFLTKLQNTINKYVSKDDNLLAMDNAPFVYLMSNAHACTPSTWDITFYSQGFNNPSAYYDYFKQTKTIPSKIVYVNYGSNDVLSIDTDYYRFNDFVNNNYDLIYEDRNFSTIDFENKNNVRCELLIFKRK